MSNRCRQNNRINMNGISSSFVTSNQSDLSLANRSQQDDISQDLQCEKAFFDLLAREIKDDIQSLLDLGINLDKGELVAKSGGTIWTGFELASGHWLAALAVGGITLLAGSLVKGYKLIKLREMKNKWALRLADLNEEESNYLFSGLHKRYPFLVGQFQNLLLMPAE
jgi:hypothetical protein